MSETDEGNIGGSVQRPRKDRRVTRRILKDIRKNGTWAFGPGEAAKLAQVIDRSRAGGTFNKKDRQILRRTLNAANKAYDGNLFGAAQSAGFAPDYNNLQKLAWPKKNSPEGWGKAAEKAAKEEGKNNVGSGKAGPKNSPGKNVDNKGNGNGKKKKGGNSLAKKLLTSSPGLQYYGLGEFPGVKRKDAANIVDRENARLIKQLVREAEARKKSQQFDVSKANALFDRTEGDLSHIFGEAAEQNQRSSQLINQGYGRQRNALEEIYGGLQGQMQGTTDANRNAAMAEMERLGIQQTGMGRFDSDAAFGNQIAATNQSNALANLGSMQRSSNEIGNMLGSMGQASLASAVGRATNDRNDYISQSRQDYRGDINDIFGDIRDVRTGRHNAITELHQAMEGNAYQRWAESQQMDWQNRLAASNFNLGVSKHNSSNLLALAELRQKKAEAAEIRRRQRQQDQTTKIVNNASQVANDFIKNFLQE